MSSWAVTWRNLTRKKLRTLFTWFAITLGVASTLAVMSSVQATQSSIANYIQSFNGKFNMNIRGTEPSIAEDILSIANRTPGITSALAHLYEPARLDVTSLKSGPKQSNPNDKVVLHGYSQLDGEITGFRVKAGKLTDKGIVLTEKAATLWGASIGDTIDFIVRGNTHSTQVTAIVAASERLSTPSGWNFTRTGRWHVAVSLPLLQQWSGQAGQVSEILVRTEEGRGQEAASLLEPQLKPFPGAYIDPMLLSASDLMYGLNDIYSGLYMLGILGMLMSVLIVFSTIYVSVVERRNEFAVMKTLGLTPQQIAVIIVKEVAVLALLGTVAGLLLGIGLAYGMTSGFLLMLDDMQEYASQGISISWAAIGLAVAAGIGGSLLASVPPLIHASRTSVVYALRRAPIEGGKRSGFAGAGVGAVLVAVGAWFEGPIRVVPLLLGLLLLFPFVLRGMRWILSPLLEGVFGFEGKVAMTMIGRRLQRNAMTSAILCIGLAFLLVVGFTRESLDNGVEKAARSMLGGDLIVNVTVPITPADIENTSQLTGVIGVSAIKETSAVWDNSEGSRKLTVTGVSNKPGEADLPVDVGSGNKDDVMRKLNEPRAVALSDVVFRAWGGQLGESITLTTPQGQMTFKVVASVHTIRENGNVLFASEQSLTNDFGVRHVKKLALSTDKTLSTDGLMNRLAELYGERLSGLHPLADYLESRKNDLLIPFSMMNALLGLIVLVSGVGILNTLMMNVFERTREFGMMRAISCTAWQIRKMVLGEGVIIGAAAVVLGLGLGLLISYTMTSNAVIAGIPISFRIDWTQMAACAGFGIAVALASAWIPAVLASRIPLSDALRYE